MKITQTHYGTEWTKCTVEDLVGIKVLRITQPNEFIVNIETEIGMFTFEHYQECCEDVSIKQVDGDYNDFTNQIMLSAEEVTSEAEEVYESGTWTFYKFRCQKGYLDISWLGESNGYYSESVNLHFIKRPDLAWEDIMNNFTSRGVDFELTKEEKIRNNTPPPPYNYNVVTTVLLSNKEN